MSAIELAAWVSGGRHPAGAVDAPRRRGRRRRRLDSTPASPAISIVVPAPPPRVRPSSGQPVAHVRRQAPESRALAARERPEVDALGDAADAAQAHLDVERARRPGPVVDGDRQAPAHRATGRRPAVAMLAATSSTVRPGDPRRPATPRRWRAGRRRRRRSWRRGSGPRRRPSASRRRGRCAWVRSRVSRSDSGERPGDLAGRGGGRDAGAPGGGGVVDAGPEDGDRDGGGHRQDHQRALLAPRDRARGHEAAQRAGVRAARGSTRSPARR